MKKLIYSKEDLDLILSLEIQKYEDKINNLQSKIDKAIELYENTPINCDGVAEDLLDKIIFDILKEDK